MITADWIHARRRRVAALAAACVALAPALAAAQDPPPPLAPSEPDAPPPAPPPPAPLAPDTPPRTDVAPRPYAPLAPPPYAVPAPPPLAPTTPPPSSADSVGGAKRMLRGLYLPSPVLIDSAFVQSHLGVGVEVGRRWDYGVLNSYPPVGIMASSSYSFQFDQATDVSTEYASFGVAVTDSVELGVSASYQSLLSTDVASSLVFGAKSAWTFQPGARFQLVRTPETALALHLYGNFGGDNQQSPVAALNEIAAEAAGIAADTGRTNCLGAGDLSCALTPAGFSTVNSATTRTLAGGGATLAVAHAFSGSIGIQSAMGLELGYRATDANGTSTGSVPINFHIGLAPSVDFGPKVPVALMAEYLLDVLGEPATGDGDGNVVQVTNSLNAGIYYTGRKDLSLGAIFGASFGFNEVLYSGGADLYPPTTVLTGQVAARYYF